MDKTETTNKKGSYLTFRLGDEEFAVHVNNVLNILELTSITKVPKTPDYMKGVINLRGTVLPVIDTRLKLGMKPTEYTDNTCIVVMDLEVDENKIYLGSLVDKVEAVHEIEYDSIKPAPEITKGIKNDVLQGITDINQNFIMVLNMEKVLSENELAGISEINQAAQTNELSNN
jgi:purine-binding chemotaxis protein CheW